MLGEHPNKHVQLAHDIFNAYARHDNRFKPLTIKHIILNDKIAGLSSIEIDEVLEHLISLGWLKRGQQLKIDEFEHWLTFEGRIAFDKGGFIAHLKRKVRRKFWKRYENASLVLMGTILGFLLSFGGEIVRRNITEHQKVEPQEVLVHFSSETIPKTQKSKKETPLEIDSCH